MDTSNDSPRGLFGRNPEAVFTEGAEKANVVEKNAITDGLFARKEKMAKQCEAQLGDLFANAKNSYGSSREVGLTAREASRVVDRAFRK